MFELKLVSVIAYACCVVATLFASMDLHANDSHGYRIVSVVAAAEAIPDDEVIVEITSDDYCTHIYTVARFSSSGIEQVSPPRKSEDCSYVGAGTIRIIVSSINSGDRVEYKDVLGRAKIEARENGVHGLLFEGVTHYDNSVWFDFMGVYRKGEAPPEFKGLH